MVAMSLVETGSRFEPDPMSGRKTFAKEFLMPSPCSLIVRLTMALMLDRTRLRELVTKPLAISQSRNLPASIVVYVSKGYGRWVKMTKSLRSKLDTPLVYLFKKFQEKYVSPLHIDAESFESTFTQGLLSYDLLQYKRATLPLNPTEICEFIRKINRQHNLTPNDVAVLCSDRNSLKQINAEFIKSEKTIAMVETTEELKMLKKFSGPETVQEDTEKLKRRKKTFFMQNSGLTKFSTVHSFKGMDSSTVFYILTEADSPELIYTGITRAKTNLIIIDLSNSTYADYLYKEIENL